MSRPTFHRCGKQVLRNGEHYADAASDEAAEQILEGLTERSAVVDWLDAQAAEKKRAKPPARTVARAFDYAAVEINAGFHRSDA